MKRRIRSKLLHFSFGIISLTLLPLFCIVYFFSNNVFEPIKGIEMGKISVKDLDRFFPYDINKFRNYKKLILNGNDKEDFNSLEMVRPLIKNLLISKDTINGIHITLSEHARFWAFIRILDIFKDEKVEYYLWEKNNFWIYYKVPLASNSLRNCVIGYPNLPYQEDSNRNNLFQEQTQSSFFLLKLFWLPSLIFMSLVWINVRRLYQI